MAASDGPDASAPLGHAPSGTITFAFTDVEGSTRRWERYGGAMQAAMRRHDALLRETLTAHAGHVFKTVGDAFCAAFARADEAVAAALAIQRALAAEDFDGVDGLRVRIAVHTGIAEQRDGDYFGPALNRVARLLALGAGGQTLVSRSTAELARDGLRDGAELEDLGEYRLRDLDRTERVFQLWAPGLERVFPPLRSGATAATNLPTPLSSFVGRELELAELQDLLGDHRLVTIVGTGGVGKTRLSIRIAETMRAFHGDGTWFVDLSDVTDPALVAAEFCSTLGVRGTRDRSFVETLAISLADKHALLVIDNCEQVVDAVATVVAYLLRHCPRLVAIATSREGLRIEGERLFPLAPLAVPSSSATTSAAEAMRHSAVVLLLDRARAAGSRFRLTDDNAPATSQLCRQLDALPFALELAASRLTLMSPQQMIDSLASHYDAMTSRNRSSSRRTSSLETLIGWSHALLDDAEQTLFRRLSAFAGSWTVEHATLVAGFEPLAPDAVLELLASLVEKSMVVADGDSTAPRFRFLESTRRYASARLAESAEAGTLGVRLRAAIAAFAREAAARLHRSDERTWLDDVEADVENVRAVLASALEPGGDVEVAAGIVSALGFFWHLRRPKEGRLLLERVRERIPEISDGAAARLFTESARIEVDLGTSVGFAREAVAFARRSADAAALARALEYLGQSLINAGEFAASELALDEAIATSPAATGSARARALRGFAHLFGCDDRIRAAADFDAALAALELENRRRDAAIALRGLAQIAVRDRRHAVAVGLIERAIQRCEGLDDPRGSGLLRFELAAALVAAERYGEARERAIAALRLLYEGDLAVSFVDTVIVFGAASAALLDRDGAAVALGFARFRMASHAPGPQARALWDRALAPLQHDPALAPAIERGAALASAPEELLKVLRDRVADAANA